MSTVPPLPIKPPAPYSWEAVKGRIFSGLVVTLPAAVTVWVVVWLFGLVRTVLVDPLARAVATWHAGEPVVDVNLAWWIEYLIAPVGAILLVGLLLYALGWLASSRLHLAFDRTLARVPLVKTVYTAVRGVVQSLDKQRSAAGEFQRVVLVPFPHPGMKVPGFVTSTCTDQATGAAILCVYVPTTPVPTSGYMLLVPEAEVTEIDWTLDQTLQAIVSGGIAVPETVRYHPLPTQTAIDRRRE